MAAVDILIPTRDRPEALVEALTALCFQQFRDFTVIIANQGEPAALEQDSALQNAIRLLALHGQPVRLLDNLPSRGMAQQRQFLLDQATAPYCLYLDDDVVLEPFVVRMLLEVLQQQACGFVGNPLIGLSFRQDYRSAEETMEFWDGPVQPETITPDSPAWQRYRLHNAANVLHVQQRLNITDKTPRPYKVAWVGGCVMYSTGKLRQVGGFSFWKQLPKDHCGEDVLAQLRVMKRFGGCGVLPSGAYHQELPTTLPNRKADAPRCLAI